MLIDIGFLLLLQTKHDFVRGYANWTIVTSPRGKLASSIGIPPAHKVNKAEKLNNLSINTIDRFKPLILN